MRCPPPKRSKGWWHLPSRWSSPWRWQQPVTLTCLWGRSVGRLTWIRLWGRTPEAWTCRQPESCRRRWQQYGRCTSCGRSSPWHRGCLATLRTMYHKKDRVMFNNLDSGLNAKYEFTCELSTRGVDGSPSVVVRGNGGGGQYRV
jgi:hypothetical protein